ncbi:hypothetical protein P378_01345 [Desulforamulus profundi]|uniref:Uncharacterized protein n=1 Tax=Desulforamulus profundi TaxID=1383067 RepID=A0A2C6MJ50_9FIRM|nr:hypothetical protein [Desulforamulus profundi]PHJ39855.1 hypothetical protein P378_01345 [Desulforamulus profundi]
MVKEISQIAKKQANNSLLLFRKLIISKAIINQTRLTDFLKLDVGSLKNLLDTANLPGSFIDKATYQVMQGFFMDNLCRDLHFYDEYHALIEGWRNLSALKIKPVSNLINPGCKTGVGMRKIDFRRKLPRRCRMKERALSWPRSLAKIDSSSGDGISTLYLRRLTTPPSMWCCRRRHR